MAVLPGTAKNLIGFDTAERINHTNASGGDYAAGDLVNIGGDVRGYCDDAIANGATGQLQLTNVLVWARAASGTTCSVGDEIWYDASAGLAVPASMDVGDTGDYPLGIAFEAKVSGQTGILYRPFETHDRYSTIRPFVRQVDCEGDTLNSTKILVPAWMNRHGLVFLAAFALVAEQFGGDTEDQGIVTIEDTDGTDICTLTPTDGGSDSVGDIIQSSISVWASATGVAWKTVTAGKGIQTNLTQLTSGTSAAGKLNVYVVVAPLL